MRTAELWKKLFDDAMKDVHTSLPARIVKFYPEKMRADIELLAKNEINSESLAVPQILNCPVGHSRGGNFIIRVPYKKGDIVNVTFSEKAIDKLLISGQPERVYYERIFSRDDAIIVNSLKLDSENDYPGENTSDLLIYHKNNGSKITMTDSGDVILEPSGNVYLGGEDATEAVLLGDAFANLYNTHTHPDPVSGNTGSPTQTITASQLSTKVKVK